MEVDQVTATQNPSAAPTGTDAAPAPDKDDPLFERGLPTLTTSLSKDQVLKTLDAAARRGNLAGFAPRHDATFEVEAFAAPFDHVLLATATPDNPGTRLTFRTQMLRKTPAIFAIIIIVSLWPGLPLTHSMLLTYFGFYSKVAYWVTAAWYIPLTVLPLLWWFPRSIAKSRQAAHASAREQIIKLRGLLHATLS